MKININTLKNKLNVDQIAVFVIIVLIIALFVIGGMILVRNYDFNGWTQTMSEKAEELQMTLFQENKQAASTTVEEDEPLVIGTSSKIYTEKAERGDGLTHLARRALASYAEETGQSFSDAQKIYIEDYVQKRIPLEKETANRWLEIGQEVEISSDLIEEAISMTDNLSASDIDHLQLYSESVSF